MSLHEKPSLAVRIGFLSFFTIGVVIALLFAFHVQARGGSFAASVVAGASAGAFGAWFSFAAVSWFWQALRGVRRRFAE
ncbi:MAG TPA: hypothetical protein VF624_08730 [Tepidisphaeraceae bacterium]|jgi:H+/Cl- antiporter ClcA